MGMDVLALPKRNTNVLVIGGPGAGKSRSYARSQRPQLRGTVRWSSRSKIRNPAENRRGIESQWIRSAGICLLNPEPPSATTPWPIVRDDKDVLRLIETLINPPPPGAQSADPFLAEIETALLQALVLYLMHSAAGRNRTSYGDGNAGCCRVREEDRSTGRLWTSCSQGLKCGTRRASP